MKSQKLKHVILTRFNLGLYDRDSRIANEWMDHRMPLFEKTRASVLSQEGDFEWVICVDSRTPHRYLEEIITDYRMSIMHEHPNTYKPDGWTITTRLDNDDLYLPGAIKAIQDSFTEQELVLDIRYQQLYQGVLYSSGTKNDGWERPRPNSPFLSLISKEKNCFARPHTKMLKDFKGIFASKEPLAYMVIHDNNLGNKIVGRKV
jgi:hypothetical protein